MTSDYIGETGKQVAAGSSCLLYVMTLDSQSVLDAMTGLSHSSEAQGGTASCSRSHSTNSETHGPDCVCGVVPNPFRRSSEIRPRGNACH